MRTELRSELISPPLPSFSLPGFSARAFSRFRMHRSALCGFVLAAAALLYTLKFMALPEGLSTQGRATLAIMAWAAIIWISEAMPVAISGLMIIMLLVLTKAVPTLAQAAGGFSNPVIYLCLAAFMFSAMLQVTRLDRKIAVNLLNRCQVRSTNGMIWSLFGVNFLLCFIVPAANARSAMLLPVVNGLTRLLGDSEAERNARKAIVIQSLVYGSMISGMCILTAHLPNLIISGLFASELGIHISYLQWFSLQWPYLGMFVITQWWVQHYFRTRQADGLVELDIRLEPVTKLQTQDHIILFTLAGIGAFWATESWHHLPTELIALLGLGLLFTPGLVQCKWQEIQDKTMWGAILMLAGALSMSSAISSSGLARWLAAHIESVAQHHPWWGILLIVMLGTHVIRLGMLSNVAAVTILAPILLALAPKLGLHPVAFTMLVADTDSFAYILPTQITAAVIAYSSGAFNSRDYARVGVVSVLIAIAYGILVMAPWYAYRGIPLWDAHAAWPY